MSIKSLMALVVVCLVSACGKPQEATAPSAAPQPVTSAEKEKALKGFMSNGTKKVRSLAEIEADEKAKDSAHAKH